MEVPNGLQTRNSGGYPQELSETQLHTRSVAGALSRQALGFTRPLVDVGCMAKVLFSYDLDVFGGIRSTQPTGYSICQSEMRNAPRFNLIRNTK